MKQGKPKVRNFVAKHMLKFNRATTQPNRKVYNRKDKKYALEY